MFIACLRLALHRLQLRLLLRLDVRPGLQRQLLAERIHRAFLGAPARFRRPRLALGRGQFVPVGARALLPTGRQIAPLALAGRGAGGEGLCRCRRLHVLFLLGVPLPVFHRHGIGRNAHRLQHLPRLVNVLAAELRFPAIRIAVAALHDHAAEVLHDDAMLLGRCLLDDSGLGFRLISLGLTRL